uniref:H0423H10.6 protein n=1 Tax=Oryza sativa TaxID=4530 RepID=Q9FSQ7_ORYSA|nr:H0423H10.6 [Oryza sativa]
MALLPRRSLVLEESLGKTPRLMELKSWDHQPRVTVGTTSFVVERLHGVLDLFWLVATSQTSHSIKARVIPLTRRSGHERERHQTLTKSAQAFHVDLVISDP